MLNTKKYLIIILVILLSIITIGACTELEQLVFDNLDIAAINQVDVPAGQYTIEYNIAELNSYVEQYGIVVSLSAVDNEDNVITLSGNTFTVEEGKVYTVTITVTSSSGATVNKVITITAVTSSETTYEVNYDLNGAPMIEPIIDIVTSGGFTTAPSITPVRAGYVFNGYWYTDSACTTAWIFDTDVITGDTTLYAGWEVAYIEWTGNELFFNENILDDSIIADYEIEQRTRFIGTYSAAELGQPDELGMVYSSSNNNPRINGNGVIRVIGNFYSLVNIQATSESLLDSTDYYFRMYTVSGNQIAYSDIVTYETAEVVPMGGQVGCIQVVSGGVYNIDNGTFIYKPCKWIEIDSDYTAVNENSNYESYDNITKSGFNSLITTETASGHRYLHVYELKFVNPAIKLSFNSCEIDTYSNSQSLSSGLLVTYNILNSYSYEIDYDIEEAGVLFSYDHMCLELGNEDVTLKTASSVDEEDTTFECSSHYNFTYNQINGHFNHNDIYARGYIKANGKISYSDDVVRLAYNDTLEVPNYEVIKTFYATTNTNTEHQFFTTAKNDVISFTPTRNTETHTGNFTLNTEGIYYVLGYNIAGTEYAGNIDINYIDKTSPVITGVEDEGTYTAPVIVICDEIINYMYITKDGGEQIEFANGVKITATGHYTLLVVGNGPNLEIEFDIT